MIPPLTRLKKRTDFVRLTREGARWFCPAFVLQASRMPPAHLSLFQTQRSDYGSVGEGPRKQEQACQLSPLDDSSPSLEETQVETLTGEVHSGLENVSIGVRVGFTASKKMGNAVKRNRAKRRLRAAVASVLPEKGCSGYDYVFVARKGIFDQPFEDLVKDMIWALKKIHENL